MKIRWPILFKSFCIHFLRWSKVCGIPMLFIAWKLSIIIYDKAGKVWRNAFGNLAAVYCSMQVYSCRI